MLVSVKVVPAKTTTTALSGKHVRVVVVVAVLVVPGIVIVPMVKDVTMVLVKVVHHQPVINVHR
jgi:hypothetical protein